MDTPFIYVILAIEPGGHAGDSGRQTVDSGFCPVLGIDLSGVASLLGRTTAYLNFSN